MIAALAAAAALAVPSGCGAVTTKALIHRFVANYDAGRVAAAERAFAAWPAFRWFSAGPPAARTNARAENRATLGAYFAARHRRHERLAITTLGAGYDPARDLVNFGGMLVRRADDGGGTRPRSFKGAASCRTGRPLLIVWSM